MFKRYLLFLFIPVCAFAYKQPTHMEISRLAADRSNLNEEGFVLQELGLRPYQLEQVFPNLNGDKKSVRELIADGANFEDSGVRALNHFYDPANDRGLSNPVGDPFIRSPDWALGVTDGPFVQENSWGDARDYEYKAITERLRSERHKSFGLLFQTLGQVIHHIEDMSQPEHVRNDPHFEIIEGTTLFGIQDPSLIEEYTNTKYIENGTALPSDYPVVTLATARSYWHTNVPGNGSQSVLSGKGISEFTNRGFVSKDTNFRGSLPGTVVSNPDYEQPVFNESQETVLDITSFRPNTNLSGEIHFFGNTVRDVYTGEETENLFMTTLSVFDEDLARYTPQVGQVFSLNSINYDAYHSFLMPRAVGYAAGLLDHFFRGRLEVTLPEAGAYGILDHAVTHTLASDGLPRDESGQIFGFEKLRVNVRNTTGPIQEPGDPPPEPVEQDLLDGEIRAVVKYQLNHCYEADLSGEMPQSEVEKPITEFQTFSGCSGLEYLTGEPGYTGNLTEALTQQEFERIAVSEPLTVGESGDVQIGRSEATEIEFDFSNDSVPVNARDVFLQVVYRGELGPEDDPSKVEQDAVVVATKDISEPTYLTIINGTDHFRLDGEFYTKEEIDNDPDLSDRLDLVIEDEAIPGGRDAILESRELTEVKLGQGTTAWASVDAIPVGRFSRIAVLTDTGTLDWTAQYFWSPYDISFPDTPFQDVHTTTAALSQFRVDDNQYDFEFYELRRGIYTHFSFVDPKWNVVFDGRGEFDLLASEIDARYQALPDFEELSPVPITCDVLGVVASCGGN